MKKKTVLEHYELGKIIKGDLFYRSFYSSRFLKKRCHGQEIYKFRGICDLGFHFELIYRTNGGYISSASGACFIGADCIFDLRPVKHVRFK